MNQTIIGSETLLARRQILEVQWRRFRQGLPLQRGNRVRDDILSSWQRSAEYIKSRKQGEASGNEAAEATSREASLLRQAAAKTRDSIMQLAKEGELVAAIADPGGRLIWTFASQRMSRIADGVNLTTGSCWDERAAGTNGVGLALQLLRPTTVFSCEHFLPDVHDWVSYAAPILYPCSGQCAGVLSLSTEWRRHTPLGQAAVTELARTIANGLPRKEPKAELEIFALGQPRVLFRGKPLKLPQRQIEILCLLALNSRGLNLEAFHAALYGDARVSFSTLKAELSHLRHLLHRQIGSRPYRLQMPVWADFIEIWQALRGHKTGEAFALYRGAFLPQSESPELEEWRRCIDAVMGQALGSCSDPVMLMNRLCQGGSGSELIRERLAELI